jgi:hypothetical protein
MAALSRECFGQCGSTRGYEEANPDCQQQHGVCQCLCHESNSGRR